MSQERLLKVLLAPHISEKTTIIKEQQNQVVFRVASDATKPEIKAAVESLFDVKVDKVGIVNVNGKTKRVGKIEGKRKGWKKAYVALAEGSSIDFVGGE